MLFINSMDSNSFPLTSFHVCWGKEMGRRSVSDYDVPRSSSVSATPVADHVATAKSLDEKYLHLVLLLVLSFIFVFVRDRVTACILVHACGSSLLVARWLVPLV